MLPGQDWYRLCRLLEVVYTISSTKLKQDSTYNETGGIHSIDMEVREKEVLRSLTEEEVYTGLRTGSLSDLGYDVRCFFLCPADRMAHFHVVDDRCERMVLSGLLRETANLYVSGALTANSQVTRAIGYRQALEYLRRDDARRHDGDSFIAFIDLRPTTHRIHPPLPIILPPRVHILLNSNIGQLSLTLCPKTAPTLNLSFLNQVW